jgi:hypothetical protein
MKRLEERVESVVVEERGEVRRRDHDIEELEDRIALLARRLEGPDQRGESFPLFPDILSVPRISAEVTSVNPEANIVMLSAGRDDGARVGFEFTVHRGSEYVGKVIVKRVEADRCSGESKRPLERMPILVGDKATTRF